MMKNKGVIIFLIIILSIFALVLLSGMFFLLSGNRSFMFFDFSTSSVSEKIVYDKTYEDIFAEINIDSDAGDIYIKKANVDEVKVKIYGDTKQLSVKDEDNLSIKYVSKKCIGFCFNVIKSKIEITLPSDYDGKINIDNKYGDTTIDEFLDANVDIYHHYGDIDIDGIKNGKIVNNCGDINIGTIYNAEVENNYGDIEIKNILSSINVEADCGDIVIKKINLEKDSSINNSFGDVEVGKTNDIRIDAHTSLGDVNVRNNNYKADIVLEIDNSCGDITVKN